MAEISVWSVLGSPHSARARLSTLVLELTRARRLQLFLEFGWCGLFFGLLAACAAVTAIRLTGAPYSAWVVVAWLVALALAAAGILAWRRRPDDLEVAIVADLYLRLEQKLSTAWEFARRAPHNVVTERLAAQVVEERMPTKHLVFPLRINTWGQLVPVALMLLALVSLVDLQVDGDRAHATSDPVIVDEGIRLREYGRRMAERARRETLPRSAAQAKAMQRLGSRMESGTLTRRQALSRLSKLGDTLDRQRGAALAAGVGADVGRAGARALAGMPVLSDGRLSSLLAQLLDGRLQPGDLESLWAEAADLSALGFTSAQLEEALENFAEGDSQALRELLERLSEVDEAVRDALELMDAQQVIELVRENLGDADIVLHQPGQPTDRLGGGGVILGMLAEHLLEGPGRSDTYASVRGRGQSSGTQSQSLDSPSPRSLAETSGPVLKPKGQPNEGQVFTTEARVLPRLGQSGIETVTLDPRFHAQLEEVLSKQAYPLHHKELVRRYFLTLSEGAAAERGPTGEE